LPQCPGPVFDVLQRAFVARIHSEVNHAVLEQAAS
jgi:hypothetical protein